MDEDITDRPCPDGDQADITDGRDVSKARGATFDPPLQGIAVEEPNSNGSYTCGGCQHSKREFPQQNQRLEVKRSVCLSTSMPLSSPPEKCLHSQITHRRFLQFKYEHFILISDFFIETSDLSILLPKQVNSLLASNDMRS